MLKNIFRLEKLEYVKERNILKLNIRLLFFFLITLIADNKNSENKTFESNFYKSFFIFDLYINYNEFKYNYSVKLLLFKFISINSYINIPSNFFSCKFFLYNIAEMEYSKEKEDYSYIKCIKNPIDIIIPVYNGFNYLDDLFKSIKNSTKINYRIIIADDKSTDNRVIPFLSNLDFKDDNYCKEIILLKNDENLGFVKTVNKASKYIKNHFVLLNTDVTLPKMWLERLIKPFFISDKKISSITPFTNSGVYFSYPIFKENNDLVNNFSFEEIDSAFMNINSTFTKNHIIHSGMGFCMAVNYDCWTDIGDFDDILFDRGYGEENDWCFRAINKGYINIICSNLFVYHKHSGSFGDERNELLAKHFKILADKYPKEIEMCREYDNIDHLKIYRLYAGFNLLKNKKNNLLFIDFDLDGGGAYFYAKNKLYEFINLNYNIILLKHNYPHNSIKLSFFNINSSDEIYLNNIMEIDWIFNNINIDYIFINNLLFMDSPSLIYLFNIIEKNKKNYKIEYVFHDFLSICQSYFLINDKNIYCGIPEIDKCNKCIKNNNNIFEKDINMNVYRSKWKRFFSVCDILTCFSNSSYNLISKIYDTNKLRVIPHKVMVKYDLKYNPNWNKKILNIGFFGLFNMTKGSKIMLELDNKLKLSGLKYKIKLFGGIEDNYNRKKHRNMEYMGKYDKNNIAELLNKNNIDVVIFPSVWPETFSYVVQELMETGVYIICFNLGAHAERIKNYANGYIADNISADSLYDKLIEFKERILK